MKVYYPQYYNDFHCIAAACPDSCCKEWTVDVDPDVREGCLIVNIGYVVAETNTRDNFVFPFYLNAAPEAVSGEGDEYV